MTPLATLLSLVLAAPAASDPVATDDDVQREIDALRNEVAALRAARGALQASPIDAERARQIRALVSDVLTDADTRAALQSTGATSGWDNGFFIASADGNFRLNIRGYTQFRWIMNDRHDPAPQTKDTNWDFDMARAQLFFEGHIVDPSLTYRFQMNFSDSGGTLSLLEAWVAKAFGDGFKLVAGQFRDPMLREFLVGETSQLAVERTLVHQAFTFDRTEGVMLEYTNDLLHLQGSFNDGAKTSNKVFPTPTTEYALVGRGEMRFGGNWAQFNDLTSFPGDSLAALIGASVGWQHPDPGTVSIPGTVLQWTVDGTVEFGGANLFAYFVGRHVSGLPSSDLDQFGAVGQAGFFVAPTVELFARYEWGDSDNGGADLSIATGGANWYLAKQRLKVTGDFGYGFNAVNSFFGTPSGITGWETDTAGDNGQWVLRFQMQVMF